MPTTNYQSLANYEFPSQEREADGPITNQAAIDSWHQKDVSVRNYILATLEQSQKQNLYGIPTAREMWLNISTQYTTRADEIEGQLLQDMWSYTYDPGKEKKTLNYNLHCNYNTPMNDMYMQQETFEVISMES